MIGKLIKFMRKSNNLTQKQLADKFKISTAPLNVVEIKKKKSIF